MDVWLLDEVPKVALVQDCIRAILLEFLLDVFIHEIKWSYLHVLVR